MSPSVGSTPYAASRRRRPSARWLFLPLLVVPIVEVAVIIGVGKVIGSWPTILLLVVLSLLGAWLLKREGTRTWRALMSALRTGDMPSIEIADAALVLMGGTLLLLPGFVTGVVGLLMVLPITRPLFRVVLAAAVARRMLAAGTVGRPGPGGPGAGPPGTSGGQSAPGSQHGPRDQAGPTIIEGEIVD